MFNGGWYWDDDISGWWFSWNMTAWCFHILGISIIPIDEVIFFRGVQTTNQIWYVYTYYTPHPYISDIYFEMSMTLWWYQMVYIMIYSVHMLRVFCDIMITIWMNIHMYIYIYIMKMMRIDDDSTMNFR